MPSRTKLLFVTEVFPYPLDRGQHVRVFNLLAACADACDVTFIAPEPPADIERAPVERHCHRIIYVGTTPVGGLARVSSLIQTLRFAPGLRTPATIRRLMPFTSALRSLGGETFDLVWAERPQMACLTTPLRVRTILDFDDIEHVKLARQTTLQRNPLARLHGAYRYAVHRHIELTWSRKCLASIVCSEGDRAYLADHGCRNAVVIPNAPNQRSFVQTSRPPADPGGPLRIAFLGHVLAAPNADAIRFFADEVLPALRAHVPDAVLDVIGPGSTPELAESYASRVRFLGFVSDLEAAFADYDMLVVPLRFGSGTKLKILDAMALRLPIVTTSIGAEGLGVEHDHHALIAETVPEIVDAILRLKRDPALSRRLTANANALVSERFSWDAIRNSLATWISELAERRPSGAPPRTTPLQAALPTR